MAKNSYPVHDFTKDDKGAIPFRLEAFGNRDKYNTGVPHRHNYYEIFIFRECTGEHIIDFEKFPIRKRSIHFLSPGQVHQVSRSAVCDAAFIAFSREFFYLNQEDKEILFDLPFFNNLSSKPVLELEEKEFGIFDLLFRQIETEFNARAEFREEMIRNYLNLFLIQAKRLFPAPEANEKTSSGGEAFRKFRVLLEKNFREWHKPSDYAGKIALTEKHLNEIVKHYSGKTISEFIQERMILEAKRLLLHSELSAKEIAFYLGFEDPSYFNKVFKRNTGVSPGEFTASNS